MGDWFAVARALIDYFIKAMAHYATTADGQKEWADVERAWELAINNEDSNIGFTVEKRAPAGQPAAAAQYAPTDVPNVVRVPKATK